MNSTNSSESFNQVENLLFLIIDFYLYYSIIVIGTVLNMICIPIFVIIIKKERANQGHMFKYFLLKSICDFFSLSTLIPELIYFHRSGTRDQSFVMQIWFISCDYYFNEAFQLMSVFFEIAASIDCLFLIKRRLDWLKSKIAFYFIAGFISLFCFLFYSCRLFQFKIVEIGDSLYKTSYTKFHRSQFVRYHRLIHNIIRDILPLFILFIVNCFILATLRNLTNRRKQMEGNSQQRPSKLVSNSQNAERNKIKMISFTSSIYLFHIPMIFNNFNYKNMSNNDFISYLCFLFLSLSYSLSIISYVLFNNTFKKYFFSFFFINKCTSNNNDQFNDTQTANTTRQTTKL
jgi:hypothetical protein